MKTKQHDHELVKFFADGRTPQVVRTRLTVDQAISACNAPSTRKEGEWFIGFRKIERPEFPRHRVSLTSALLAHHNGLGAGRTRNRFD